MQFALLQLTSGLEYKANLNKVRELYKTLKSPVQGIFLPECFFSLSNGDKPSPYLIDSSNENCQFLKELQNLGKDLGCYLLGGSAATKVDEKIVNRAYFIDPLGKVVHTYDKKKLFACDLGKKIIRESNIYSPGTSDLELFELNEFKFAANICFDLRFASQSSLYKNLGANVFLYPSAFTKPTGKAHWHTLLKARAIENQCFVVASAQWGLNNDKISTYGHSLVVDPWGEVIVDLKEGESIQAFEMNLELMTKVKKQVIMDACE